MLRRSVVWSMLVWFLASSDVLAKPNPADPIWETFVVGKIDAIPNSSLRRYLYDAQYNNPYASTIAKELAELGPFAPGKGNVFWLPSIDVAVTPRNWRFVSRVKDAPKHIQKLAIVEIDGKQHIRMILHPYSVKEKAFQEIAAKNGGFKFEHQGATTASVRSLVAWQTSRPRPTGGAGSMDVPDSLNKFFHAKVSLYGIDINGSRLNPAKKMARAESVTRLMAAIPASAKKKHRFDFSGEWVVGVPDGTDAGFVYRELLEPYTAGGGRRVEPGYAVLRPERLTEIVAGSSEPLEVVTEKVFRPIANITMYLFFEEMMIGEMHSQNYAFVVNRNNRLTGEIVIHDADAFRTSLQARVLAGKTIDPIRSIEDPFYYMKDSIFTSTQGTDGESYTLNGLLDYLMHPNDETSMVDSVYKWCIRLVPKPGWCTKKQIRQRFLVELAELSSPYLQRQVAPSELDVTGEQQGSVGLISLFKERLRVISQRFARLEVNEAAQGKLRQYFDKVLRGGMARTYGAFDPETHVFSLNEKDGTTAILAHSRKDPSIVRGIGLLLPDDDPATIRLFRDLKLEKSCRVLNISAGKASDALDALPLMRRMGGGSSVSEFFEAIGNWFWTFAS